MPGFTLGGIFRTAVRAGIGLVPGGSSVLGAYDAYNTSRGRTGAFSPSQAGGGLTGGGTIKGGGAGRSGMPPALPSIVGGAPAAPGTSIANIPGMGMTAGSGAGEMFQTPDGQWHAKTWRGSKGHMTKGSRRSPPHWTNRRRPRMNPMNVHAARRSVRRLVAGEKLFRKIFRIMHHHKAAVAVKRGRK